MPLLDPRIGQLASGHFYCFADGYDRPEFVGTLAEVEQRLGLRAPASTPTERVAKKTVASKAGSLRDYEVTVTPRQVAYAGTWRGGAYTVTVSASSRAKAISQVRTARRLEEGRFAVPADFTARRVPDRD